MKRTILFVVLWAVAANAQINPDSLESDIKFLASDRLQGRLTGSPQAADAAEWIAGKFKAYGLISAVPEYFQKYDFNSKAVLGKNNSLAFFVKGKQFAARLHSDYVPYVFSDSGKVKSPLVFAGYGISAKDSSYDDYAGIDVKGKAVLIMRGSPEEDSTNARLYRFSPIRMKLMAARDKGAAVVLVANGKENKSLAKFEYDYSSRAGVPVVNISYAFAKRVLIASGFDLEKALAKIEKTQEPNSSLIKGAEVSISVDISILGTKAINVAGMVAPPIISDSTFYVIGAHYDHLGWGPYGSMAPDTIAIHHGADDNASGVAGLLELARYYGSHPQLVKKPILFVSFSGEEEGLLGSQYFVEHLPVDKSKVAAILNMDMVGRLRNDKLIVGGIGSALQWESLVKTLDAELGKDSLKLSLDMAGFGPSDHASFYVKSIPVLFFFTDVHSDYHKPSDTYDKVNYVGEERVVTFVKSIIDSLQEARWVPTYAKVVAAEKPSGGPRVYLGTIPDFGSQANGYKLSGVTPGSPAEKAGLKGGDVITKIGAREIKNIYDLMYILQELKPEEKVAIEYLRDGRKETTAAVVGRK